MDILKDKINFSDWKEMIARNVSVREVFLIFFGNKEFVSEIGKKY